MLLLAGTLSAQAAESLPFTQNFTKGLGKFTTTGTVKWRSDKNYGAVCKAGSKTAAEGWLISPAIDLSNTKNALATVYSLGGMKVVLNLLGDAKDLNVSKLKDIKEV